MVQQVASVKMFLSSFKKDSEYVLVEIPKRPEGKLKGKALCVKFMAVRE